MADPRPVPGVPADGWAMRIPGLTARPYGASVGTLQTRVAVAPLPSGAGVPVAYTDPDSGLPFGDVGTTLIAHLYNTDTELHGGHVGVSSRLGRGTTFRVHLPAAPAVEEAVGSGVTQFKVGDEVFGCLPLSGMGSFAEYVCASENAALAAAPGFRRRGSQGGWGPVDLNQSEDRRS